jgi:hypothetical protein
MTKEMRPTQKHAWQAATVNVMVKYDNVNHLK